MGSWLPGTPVEPKCELTEFGGCAPCYLYNPLAPLISGPLGVDADHFFAIATVT